MFIYDCVDGFQTTIMKKYCHNFAYINKVEHTSVYITKRNTPKHFIVEFHHQNCFCSIFNKMFLTSRQASVLCILFFLLLLFLLRF